MTTLEKILDLTWWNQPNKLKSILLDLLNVAQPTYKIYTAIITQSGTDAPVAVVNANTLGGEIIWTRTDVGEYLGTLQGIFSDPDKGFIQAINSDNPSPDVVTYCGKQDANSIYIQTKDESLVFTDGLLQPLYLEIRVYNE